MSVDAPPFLWCSQMPFVDGTLAYTVYRELES